MNNGTTWTEEQLASFIRAGGRVAPDRRIAVPVANVEPSAKHEPVAKKETPRLDSQGGYRVRFTGYRKRLADSDGQCGKYALDGLVHAGIFRDDRPEIVREVSFSQVPIGKDEQEKTVIEIRRA